MSTDLLAPRYIRKETMLEVFDTDERGPGIEPIEVIRHTIWVHASTDEPVTDPAELERLNRENPATI